MCMLCVHAFMFVCANKVDLLANPELCLSCVSHSTVRCLSMVSGASLLGMTREELKMVCPDEGGRVFFQLQNVKSANAVSSHGNLRLPHNS